MWTAEELAVSLARAKVDQARDRVVKAAMHWAKLQTSTARARDLALACNRLEEARSALAAAKKQREGQ